MCTHMFGLDNVLDTLTTVRVQGQHNAIHCWVDPWQ